MGESCTSLGESKEGGHFTERRIFLSFLQEPCKGRRVVCLRPPGEAYRKGSRKGVTPNGFRTPKAPGRVFHRELPWPPGNGGCGALRLAERVQTARCVSEPQLQDGLISPRGRGRAGRSEESMQQCPMPCYGSPIHSFPPIQRGCNPSAPSPKAVTEQLQQNEPNGRCLGGGGLLRGWQKDFPSLSTTRPGPRAWQRGPLPLPLPLRSPTRCIYCLP